MKQIISWWLVVVLAFGVVTAFAEDGFTLRNGICFGDTEETVRSKETLAFQEKNEDSIYLDTIKGTVAGIDDVSVEYMFDDAGGLNEVAWSIPDYNTQDAVESAYETLKKALTKKYGEPLGNNNGDCYIIMGSALMGAALIAYLGSYSKNSVGDFIDYDEWVVPYGDGNNVKIEIAMYYYGSSYSTRTFSLNVSYMHFTDEELQVEMDKKKQEMDAVDNDI